MFSENILNRLKNSTKLTKAESYNYSLDDLTALEKESGQFTGLSNILKTVKSCGIRFKTINIENNKSNHDSPMVIISIDGSLWDKGIDELMKVKTLRKFSGLRITSASAGSVRVIIDFTN